MNRSLDSQVFMWQATRISRKLGEFYIYKKNGGYFAYTCTKSYRFSYCTKSYLIYIVIELTAKCVSQEKKKFKKKTTKNETENIYEKAKCKKRYKN